MTSTRSARRLTILTLLTVAFLAVPAPRAEADSTPVGPLPGGPTTTVTTARGTLVAIALPRQKASTGLVWRLARRVNGRVVHQVSEADVGAAVVVVFRTVGPGAAPIVFALTKGDASSRAVRAARYRVMVA